MRALVIDPPTQAAIDALIAKAAGAPTSWATLQQAIADRAPPPANKDCTIDVPIGYTVTYTHEEQPAGLCRHISISVDRDNVGPSPVAVDTLLQAFGFKNNLNSGVIAWFEEIGRGRIAVNALEPLDGDLSKLRAAQ